MEILDPRQTYNILQNLSNLEISYMEYSKSPKDFVKYQSYLEYFNNYIIKSKNLHRFYFPAKLSPDMLHSQKISDLGEILDIYTIAPGYDFCVSKHFNFPSRLRHKCNYYTLVYLFEGSGTLIMDENTFSMRAGDFYLIPPGVYYATQTSPESLCIYMDLRQSFVAVEYKNIFHEDPLITSFITHTFASEHHMTYLAIHTGENETVRTLVLTIFTEYINQDKYSRNTMKNFLSLLFALILRSDKTTLDASVKTTRLDQQYQQIISYLKQNYPTADLSSLSDQIHFSKQYICKIVKKKTGDTFNALLMKIRLEMVEQYLLESDLVLEDIAYLCGFTAPSHLSKVFKNHYGVSPSVYRKEHMTRFSGETG